MDSDRSHLDRNVSNNMLYTKNSQQQNHRLNMIERCPIEAVSPRYAHLHPIRSLDRGQCQGSASKTQDNYLLQQSCESVWLGKVVSTLLGCNLVACSSRHQHPCHDRKLKRTGPTLHTPVTCLELAAWTWQVAAADQHGTPLGVRCLNRGLQASHFPDVA